MAGAVPGTGDGEEDVRERFAEDQQQTCEPEMNPAFRMAFAEKMQEYEEETESRSIEDEMRIHGRGTFVRQEERETVTARLGTWSMHSHLTTRSGCFREKMGIYYYLLAQRLPKRSDFRAMVSGGTRKAVPAPDQRRA